MSCFEGHMPHMTQAQLRQAMEAYYEAYARGVEARWQQSPWVRDLFHQAREVPRPKHTRRPVLQEARPGEKVDAIDVEFRRVR